MTIVGAFTMVWRESRYLGPVLEQMRLVHGPRAIIWNDRPYFWLDGQEPPSGHECDPVARVLGQFPDLYDDIIKLSGQSDTETVLRNVATASLRQKGAETIIWLDSDFLFDLKDFDRLVAEMEAAPPSCWTVQARHYWRNWETLYSKGNFRIGYPAAATWEDGSFGREFEETARHAEVMCHHPSYVLTDREVETKLRSWFHAPLATEAKWWEKWQSKEWDKEQKLEPADVPLPEGLKERLTRWGSWLP